MKVVSSGINGKIRLFDVNITKETAKTYYVTVDGFISADKVIKKEELMQVKGGTFFGSFKVYCNDEDVPEAFSKVQSSIRSYCNNMNELINVMLKNCEEMIIHES